MIKINKKTYQKMLGFVPQTISDRAYSTAQKHNSLLRNKEKRTLFSVYQYFPKSKDDIHNSFSTISVLLAPMYHKYQLRHLGKAIRIKKGEIVTFGSGSSKSVPLLLRQAIYCTLYMTFQAIDTTEERKYGILRQDKITRKFFDYFNNALIGLNHQGVVTSNILLADKWNYHILRDYCNNRLYMLEEYIPPKFPFDYAGHKDGYLGYLLNHLVIHSDYDEYVELFGGSGIGICQHPHKPFSKEYISDYNPWVNNFYTVISRKLDCFVKYADYVVKEFHRFSKMKPSNIDPSFLSLSYTDLLSRTISSFSDDLIYALGYFEYIRGENRLQNKDRKLLHEESINDFHKKPNLAQYNNVPSSLYYPIGLFQAFDYFYYFSDNSDKKVFKDKVKPKHSRDDLISDINQDDVRAAYAFFYIHMFMFNGIRIEKNLINENSLEDYMKLNIANIFKDYSKRMSQVIINPSDDAVNYVSV